MLQYTYMLTRLRGVSTLILALILSVGTGVYTLHSQPSNLATGGQVLAAEIEVPQQPSEPTDRTPEVYQASFSAHTPQQALQQLDVAVLPQDKIFVFPDLAYGLGGTIKVYRAQAVVITDAKTTYRIHTWAKNVDDLVAEQHIELASQDVVTPSKDSAIMLASIPVQITITRVAQSQLLVNEDIAFTTQTTEDASLERGDIRIDQAGIVGILERTYLVRRENGIQVSKILVAKKVITQPTPKKVHHGTHVTEYGSGGASWYSGVGALTVAHRTLPFGTKLHITNKANGKSVVVTVADRGPFIAGRLVDLSYDAFAQIASPGAGVVQVNVEAP